MLSEMKQQQFFTNWQQLSHKMWLVYMNFTLDYITVQKLHIKTYFK